MAGGMPQGAVCMAYPDENLMTPAARDFISWLRMALRKPGSSAGVTVGIDSAERGPAGVDRRQAAMTLSPAGPAA